MTEKADGPAIQTTSNEAEALRRSLGRYDHIPRPAQIAFLALTIAAVGLYIFYNFGLNFYGWVIGEIQYYYALYVILMMGVFLVVPMRQRDKTRLPWYDIAIGLAASGITCFYMLRTASIDAGSWEPPPNNLILATAIILLIISLESGRRIASIPFLAICIIFGSYPLYADLMPGIFNGVSLTFPKLMSRFAFSVDGILGLPAQVNGKILIGYLVFSGTMVGSGAGKFFLDMALALFGRFRGGPAKVAVISSALFGSLNGSPVSNVVSTGAITIPAMKSIGYPAHYAGAIEACASTGGAITPPVMGTIAFIMAIITGIDYGTIIIAAVIPAVLYFFGLLVQVDGYAARSGFKGIPREDCPSAWKTLKGGWPFIFSFVLLIVLLVVFKQTVKAPIIASASMMLLSYTSKETALNWQRLEHLIASVGSLVCWMVAILLPVGLVVAGLVVTGTTASLITAIVGLGAGNVLLILLITGVASYLLGMIGMSLIPYLFLAVTMAPAVIKVGGLDPLAVHMFLIYYVVLTGITPPVAVVAFVAGSVAGAPPMKTAITALRLGIVLVFIPYVFVFRPELVLIGTPLDITYYLAAALAGIWLLTSGLEGYMLRVGILNWWTRPIMVIAGLMVAIPIGGGYGFEYKLIGLVILALGLVVHYSTRRFGRPPPPGTISTTAG